MQTVHRKLEASRRDLLDLGLRNPLISFRPRTRSIEVVGEGSSEVHRILVIDGKEMSFDALPGPIADLVSLGAIGDATTEEVPEVDWEQVFGGNEGAGSERATRRTDRRLQTRLSDESLTTRLITIQSNARTCIEEQGVNILYLALGFLHWFESDAAAEPRTAPLLLVPIALRRTNAQQRFKAAWSGDDVGDNLSLREKLKSDFGITLPVFAADSDTGVAAYIDAVASAIAGQKRWRVAADEIHLGFFSFGKFLMYHDLDVSTWPSPDEALAHPILRALFDEGFRSEPSPYVEDDHLDETVSPDAIHTVVDADATQTLALLDAAAGRTMRIEGPPGTGKSQTITNLIADAIGKGKRVLFVSEKMAALEVVKRRLDKLQLGDAVLELHSHKANKRALIDELRRTTDLGRPSAKAGDDDLQQLTRVRERLNAYSRAVNEPLGASGVAPIHALGRMLQLKESSAVQHRFDYGEMHAWSAADFRERRTVVAELATKLEQMGCPSKNPFWGSCIRLFSPVEHDSLRDALTAAAALADQLSASGLALATRLQLAVAACPEDVAVLCRAARRAMDAPHDVGALALRSADWQARRDDIRKLVAAGERWSQLLSQHEETLIPEAWEQDLLDVREALVTCSGSWWRRLFGRFRRARGRLRGLMRTDLPKDRAQWLAIVDAVLEARRARIEIDELELLGQGLFRAQWQGLGSDWVVLTKLSNWVISAYREVGDGSLPAGLLDFLSGNPRMGELQTDIDRTETALQEVRRATIDLQRRLAVATGSANRDPLAPMSLADAGGLLRNLASRLDELGWLADFNRISSELETCGLPTVVRRAADWIDDSKAFLSAIDWTWYEGIFNAAFSQRPALQTFDRVGHEQAIKLFRNLDTDLQQHTRARLMLTHWEQLPRASADGEVATLRREMNKRRGLLPIRRVIQDAGRAMQAIKPVFMMSPLSVATFLPPGSVEFDLVVFDEASQVKPVDAIGAILRSRQAIVVGDTKQLPPTTFFDQMAGTGTEDEENTTADQESILGLFDSQGAHNRMLRWHYRSRHESLIAVSNQEFYDSRLVVFPAAGHEADARGLIFRHLPETEYGRGASRSNKGEAKAVAEAVMQHARTHPELSLGVAAFSQAQRDAIEMEIEFLRRADSGSEEFFQSGSAEPFFVKNLENVQGDERDVILISIGYGKTKEGYLAMNFGPLNRDGGERRLNVLITRARLTCEVFCNFTADDIDLARSNARGVVALKQFLAYARDRTLFLPISTHRAPDSPFEEAVLHKLAGVDLQVEPQVGCAGFFIDIGVRDPEMPGRYLLGVECDGAAYHSARSARDRDRLREAVLRNLGWEIHRIWSTDWFRNPDRECKRVLEAVESAKLAHKRRQARSIAEVGPRQLVATSVVARSEVTRADLSANAGAPPYRKARFNVPLRGRQLHELTAPEISICVASVVKEEGPIAMVEVARRLAEAAGLQRIGSRIQTAVEFGVRHAVSEGHVHQRRDFLWPTAMTKPSVRDRSDLDAQSRKLELVCDEEIAAALSDEISRAFSIDREGAFAAALRRVGFQRVSPDMKDRCSQVLAAEIQGRRIVEQDGRLMLPRA